MKAKEQAQLYADAENKSEALAIITRQYLDDAAVLMRVRRVNDSGMYRIFDELNAKWRSLARLTGLNPNGYLIVLADFNEGVYARYAMLRGLPPQSDLWLRERNVPPAPGADK